MIRKISLVILVLVGTSTASFSMGTIHLFADTTSLEFSADISELGTQNVWIVYAPTDEEGQDCISGLEFMVHWEATQLVHLNSPVFREDLVELTEGTIRTGMMVALSHDVIVEGDYLFIGYFSLLGLQAIVAGSDPVILSVVAYPGSLSSTPVISDCSDFKTVREVRGAQFVLPYEARVISAESKSWGAIKALY